MLRELCLILGVSLAAGGLSRPAHAQAGDEVRKIDLRVVSSRPGSVTLDRGGNDGLRKGDRVTLRLKDGTAVLGTLLRIEERGSIAELDDQSLVIPAGTRAEVLVPVSRLAQPEAAPTTPADPQDQQAAPPHAPWKARDDQWSEGQPLLARVRPLRPSERPSDFRGRVYSIFDFTNSTEDERTDGFYRLGTDLTLENAFGDGERIHFDSEVNYRDTDVPDNDDETSTHLRIDRASYAVGGNRFEDNRYEFGRFLQDNMPEFGVVDGAEWDRRLDNGHRIGFSAGFMPEPDAEQKTVQDFQVAASYRWLYDESEQLSAAAGFQKTLHDGDADRDLLVAQVAYLPQRGWTFTSTAWIDYYSGGDANKGQGVELTQAYANTARRWADGSSVLLAYSHIAFPELDRDEFRPVTAAQLADDHNDRVSCQGRLRVANPVRIHGLVAAWADQDDSGGDGEGGFEVENFFFPRLWVDFTGFTTQAKFVELLGARATFAYALERGRLSLEYELSNSRFDGFSGGNNDLPQHRLRLEADHYFVSGWSLAAHLDGLVWDNENSINLGFYLQKSF
ncbi:MAG TPA: hypothetical protein VK843_00950 [Planctomycetota bacterium]|nr:hypothetical protein [Planctomycetota bacterium]